MPPKKKKKVENKKLFISCPMRGFSEEEILENMKKLHEIAEIVFNQKLDAINTYFEDTVDADVNVPIYFLGKSIMAMSEADYFIGFDGSYYFESKHPGCFIEKMVADDYNIKSFLVDPGTFGVYSDEEE